MHKHKLKFCNGCFICINECLNLLILFVTFCYILKQAQITTKKYAPVLWGSESLSYTKNALWGTHGHLREQLEARYCLVKLVWCTEEPESLTDPAIILCWAVTLLRKHISAKLGQDKTSCTLTVNSGIIYS